MDNNLRVTEVQRTFLNGSKLWSKGALYQGNRLFSVLAQIENTYSKITADPDSFFSYADLLRELSDLLNMKKNFLCLLYIMPFFSYHIQPIHSPASER